jgi:predicted alpha/beta hydrolase
MSVDVDTLQPDALGVYAQMCGWTLARAHARSGDAVAIASYIGRSDTFPQALSRFAVAYADQNEADHDSLVAAIANGTVAAETGY